MQIWCLLPYFSHSVYFSLFMYLFILPITTFFTLGYSLKLISQLAKAYLTLASWLNRLLAFKKLYATALITS